MKMNMWFNRRNEIYNPLYSAEIVNHTKRISCEQEDIVDLYINHKCVTQPGLNLASKAFGSTCCGKNTDFYTFRGEVQDLADQVQLHAQTEAIR